MNGNSQDKKVKRKYLNRIKWRRETSGSLAKEGVLVLVSSAYHGLCSQVFLAPEFHYLYLAIKTKMLLILQYLFTSLELRTYFPVHVKPEA